MDGWIEDWDCACAARLSWILASTTLGWSQEGWFTSSGYGRCWLANICQQRSIFNLCPHYVSNAKCAPWGHHWSPFLGHGRGPWMCVLAWVVLSKWLNLSDRYSTSNDNRHGLWDLGDGLDVPKTQVFFVHLDFTLTPIVPTGSKLPWNSLLNSGQLRFRYRASITHL